MRQIRSREDVQRSPSAVAPVVPIDPAPASGWSRWRALPCCRERSLRIRRGRSRLSAEFVFRRDVVRDDPWRNRGLCSWSDCRGRWFRVAADRSPRDATIRRPQVHADALTRCGPERCVIEARSRSAHPSQRSSPKTWVHFMHAPTDGVTVPIAGRRTTGLSIACAAGRGSPDAQQRASACTGSVHVGFRPIHREAVGSSVRVRTADRAPGSSWADATCQRFTSSSDAAQSSSA